MKRLSDSLEDYIEGIYYICCRKVSSRPSDVAMYLGVKMSSVTRALRCLSEEGLVHYSKYKSVLLSEKGREYAESILQRHRLAYEFLHFVLGLDAYAADIAAQKMKKALDEKVSERMRLFLRHHARDRPHVHEDCTHNEMRCMLCKLSAGVATRESQAKTKGGSGIATQS